MTVLFANDAGTTLASSAASGATTITLTSGGGALFPSPTGTQLFPVTLRNATNPLVYEIMYCTSRTTDVLTVTRAQEGTSALAWNAGDIVQCLATAATLQMLGQLVAYGGAANSSGSGTSLSTSVSFTAPYKCLIMMNGNAGCTSGEGFSAATSTPTNATVVWSSTNYSAGPTVGGSVATLTSLLTAVSGAAVTLAFYVSTVTTASGIAIGFNYVLVPIP